MFRTTRFAVGFPLLLLALAAPAQGQRSALGPPRGPQPGRVISAEQIEAWRVHTAWEAIQRGATHLALGDDPMAGEVSITRRSARPSSEPLVVVDGVRMGGAAVLREIPAHDIARISVLSPVEAASRYGLGSAGGVISVETRT